MPQRAFSLNLRQDLFTLKKCPPVIDAMTAGFLMPLACDVSVQNGEFSWDRDLPACFSNYSRSPIGFHDPSQVAGSPFFDGDQFIIKFHNFWTIKLPEGYSLLVTHPINRDELPFRTLTGLVDADRYCDLFIEFPARWSNPDFNGTLPKGTPVAQCIPVKRTTWNNAFDVITGDAAARLEATGSSVAGSMGTYRHQFRAPKR